MTPREYLWALIPPLCPHPVKWLFVQKNATYSNEDNDYVHVTYHLNCHLCQKDDITITYAHAKWLAREEGDAPIRRIDEKA